MVLTRRDGALSWNIKVDHLRNGSFSLFAELVGRDYNIQTQKLDLYAYAGESQPAAA